MISSSALSSSRLSSGCIGEPFVDASPFLLSSGVVDAAVSDSSALDDTGMGMTVKRARVESIWELSLLSSVVCPRVLLRRLRIFTFRSSVVGARVWNSSGAFDFSSTDLLLSLDELDGDRFLFRERGCFPPCSFSCVIDTTVNMFPRP